MNNKNPANQATVRFQIDLSERELASLNEMMTATGISTKKELFNNAISLFEWAVNEIKVGNRVGSVDPKTNQYTRLAMPALAFVERHGGKDPRPRVPLAMQP